MELHQYSHLWRPKKLFDSDDLDFTSKSVYPIQRNWSPGVDDLPWSETSDGGSESNTSLSFTIPITTKKVFKVTKMKATKKNLKKNSDHQKIENSKLDPGTGTLVLGVVPEEDRESKGMKGDRAVEGMHDKVALQMIPDLNSTGMAGYPGGVVDAGEQVGIEMPTVNKLAPGRRTSDDHVGNDGARRSVAERTDDVGGTMSDRMGTEVKYGVIELDEDSIIDDKEDQGAVMKLGGEQSIVEGFKMNGDDVQLDDDGGDPSVVKVMSVNMESTKQPRKGQGRMKLSTRSSAKKGIDHAIDLETDAGGTRQQYDVKASNDVTATEGSDHDSDVILVETEENSSKSRGIVKKSSRTKDTGRRAGSASRRKSLRLGQDGTAVATSGMWDYQGLDMEVHPGSRKRQRNGGLVNSDAVVEDGSGRIDVKNTEALQEMQSEVVEEVVSNAKRRKSLRIGGGGSVGELGKWDYRESDSEMRLLKDRKRKKSGRDNDGEEMNESEEESKHLKRKRAEVKLESPTRDKSKTSRSKSVRKGNFEQPKSKSEVNSKISRKVSRSSVKEKDDITQPDKSGDRTRVSEADELDDSVVIIDKQIRNDSDSTSDKRVKESDKVAAARKTGRTKGSKGAREVQKKVSTKHPAGRSKMNNDTIIKKKLAASDIHTTSDSSHSEMSAMPDSGEGTGNDLRASKLLKLTNVQRDGTVIRKGEPQVSDMSKVSDISKVSDLSKFSDGSRQHSDSTYHDVSVMVNSKQDISLSQIRKALTFTDDNGSPSVKFSEEPADEYHDQELSDNCSLEVAVEASDYRRDGNATNRAGHRNQTERQYPSANRTGETSRKVSKSDNFKQRSKKENKLTSKSSEGSLTDIAFLWCPHSISRSSEELNAVDVCLSVYDRIIAQAIRSTSSASVKSALVKHRRITQERLMEMV